MSGPPGRRVLLGAAALLAACASPLAWMRPVVLPPGGDEAAHGARVAGLARQAEVVYLGEVHDNPHHHANQRAALAAMVAAGARPALAFEMVPATDQGALDRAISSGAGQDELARRLAWRARGWPDFAMYWPLFELAMVYGLPVVAIDLDPVLARRIAREGLAGLGERALELATLLSPDSAREAAIARTIQKAHCDLLPARMIPRMVQSWHARNVTMARRLAEALDEPRQVVVIVGRGHQEAGGLTDQLAALRPGTRQLVVDMLEVGPGQAPEEVARQGVGQVVWLAPEAARPDPCEGLRRRLQKPEEMAGGPLRPRWARVGIP
jgi:uncharacterized iron-regulated protein